MRHLLLIVLFFVGGFYWASQAQSERKVAVLNMTNYNGETGTSRLLSAVRVMRLMGVPYDTTSNLTVAIQYPIVLTGSRIKQDAFSTTEISTIENYVANGGVLITSSLRDTNFFDICGIDNITSEDTLYEIEFDTTSLNIFDYINDSLEVKISIGDSANAPTYYTRFYNLDGAVALGSYENNECALAYNQYGNGHVYTFGPDFRDILYRNQTNFDYSAHRTYSNGFEPSTDVIMFLLRNIVRKHIPNTIYKYTQPFTAHSTLMVTHDVDSKTGMDTMHIFSEYEEQQGISAHYNVTTRYLNDTWMTNFYIGSWPNVHNLLDDGHVLASHSVGHFPDFNDDAIFPLGTLGNTSNNYEPLYFGGITTGGTVIGELEVSKNLIIGDHTVNIKSFRAGHLCYNDSLIIGLEMTDYEFNSTFSANDVLSSFPYYAMRIRSFSAEESTILEIPMTISDVFSSDPITSSNYPQKVAKWTNATNRYHENHSPVVLLIHPNRNYKLTAFQDYLATLPSGLEIYPFEKYGQYWRKRDSLTYSTDLAGSELTVTIESSNLIYEQSFVVDYTGLDTVVFEDEIGNPIPFEWINWNHGTRLYYQEEPDTSTNIIAESDQLTPTLFVYPNPTNGEITIFHSDGFDGYQLKIMDLSGKLLYTDFVNTSEVKLDLEVIGLQTGTYLVVSESSEGLEYKKIFYSK